MQVHGRPVYAVRYVMCNLSPISIYILHCAFEIVHYDCIRHVMWVVTVGQGVGRGLVYMLGSEGDVVA